MEYNYLSAFLLFGLLSLCSGCTWTEKKNTNVTAGDIQVPDVEDLERCQMACGDNCVAVQFTSDIVYTLCKTFASEPAAEYIETDPEAYNTSTYYTKNSDCQALKLELLGGAHKMERVGATTTLTCTLDKGLDIILSYSIKWVHVPIDALEQRDPASRREKVLTNQETLTDLASPDFYGIQANYNITHCNFTLTLKELQPDNDGMYICRVTSHGNSSDRLEATADIIVVNDVESIAMQFDGEDSITGISDVLLQREEGHYAVTCTAFSFNPDASIQLYLGDKELDTGGTQILPNWEVSKKVGARRYSASATTTKLHLGAEHMGQVLKCSAVAGFDGATPVVASVPLLVIVFEPIVTCDQNVSARVGDLYVKITCKVDHPNVVVERYLWEIGKTGETLEPNQSNENFHEVTVKELDGDSTMVTLDLYQVDDLHFDTYYYLDVITQYGQFREKTMLIKLESDDPSSSTKTTVVRLVCLLSVMLSIFSCY